MKSKKKYNCFSPPLTCYIVLVIFRFKRFSLPV
nr:MAG TPA: hypothetical protein [Caudoviricetes sp.]